MLSTILKHPVSMKTLLTDIRSICKITQMCLRQDKNVFPMALTVRTFQTNNTRLSDGLVQSARFLKPGKLSHNLVVRHQHTIKLDVDINVKNNVILYKNDNKKHIRWMLISALVQLVGWSLLAIYTFTPRFFDIFRTDVTFDEYISRNIFRLSFFIFSIIIGPVAYATISILCGHTVRYIILHKGGKTVTFITSNLWNKEYSTQVPIGNVRSVCQRSNEISTVPLKLKGKYWHYLVETDGKFLNPELFDHTLGYSNFRNV